MDTPHEKALSVSLKSALVRDGLNAHSEVKHKYGGITEYHDIDVRFGSFLIAIEAKIGNDESAKQKAFLQAKKRISQGICSAAVALVFPPDMEERGLYANPNDQTLLYARVGDETDPIWTEGNVKQFAEFLLNLPNELGNPDRLVSLIENSLKEAESYLSGTAKQTMLEILDLPGNDRKEIRQSTKRGLLVLSTGIMFHEKINAIKYQILEEGSEIKGAWPPASPAACLEAENSAAAFAEAWRAILLVNYDSVFRTAHKLVKRLRADVGFNAALKTVGNAALSAIGSQGSHRHDLLGRLFHKILHTAKNDGSFYTSSPAATILASLAIPSNTFKTGGLDADNFKVVDVTCGTGTLLIASAERLIGLYPEKFQKSSLLKKVLHGFDSNVTALHMAETTLGLLAHDKPYYRSNLNHVPLGVGKNGEAKIGSLELLYSRRIKGGRIGSESMDLVIMNPPYTRNDLRNQQFSDADKKLMQDREKKVLATWTMDGTLDLTSQANSFIVLAEWFLKDGGTMASVMPAAVTSNPSALGCRKYIGQKFQVEAIVSVYDPDRPAFSESTGISEVLLLCKKGPNVRRSPTKLIKIRRNPATATSASRMANLINRRMLDPEYDAPDDAGFHIDEIPYKKIASGDWTPINFFIPSLAAKFFDLREGKIFGKAIRLGDVICDTLNGRNVRKDFMKDSLGDRAGMKCFWKNETDRITLLNPKFDSYLKPKNGRKEQCRKHWARAGRLLFPAKIYLSEARVTAILADSKVLGDQWTVVRVKGGEGISEADMEKAVCAYLNSSLGVLGILGGRDLQVFMRPAFSLDSMRRLPIPDFESIGEVSQLAERFDALLGKEFQPLKKLDRCENRIELDSAVADYLKIPKSAMEEIREKLVAEPVISLKICDTADCSFDLGNSV